MCIEEPEIHLHPSLQRKLIAYLEEYTSSQYFIATHSAAFIDFPNASVFHVRNDGNQTFIRNAITTEQSRLIVDELGFKASDLLQTNYIIWVEGPSDRIYLRHWLSAVDPDLFEGVHFTVMFYGGALISHLSVSNEAVDAFISLQSVNRNMAVVLDSDRTREEAELKPHVARIKSEMSNSNGIVWITSGREIENYVDPVVLHEALREVHSKTYLRKGKTGRYDNSFHFYQKDKDGNEMLNKKADKVSVAYVVCKKKQILKLWTSRNRLSKSLL